jgi:hypothetical protein
VVDGMKTIKEYLTDCDRLTIPQKLKNDVFTGQKVEVSTDDRTAILIDIITNEIYRYVSKIETATGTEIVKLLKEFEEITRLMPVYAKHESFIYALSEYDKGSREDWEVIGLLF